MRSFLTVVSFVACSFFALTTTHAQTNADIPPELRPWVGWVQAEIPDLYCPEVMNQRTCAWPGTLKIDVQENGATFTLNGYLDADGELPLPGGDKMFPQNVTANGGKALVSKNFETPIVVLPRGTHTVTGRFTWKKTPDVLAVPQTVGRVDLTVGGQTINFPRVDDQGRLYLRDGEAATALKESDSVRVSTYRQLMDGVPFRVTTRLDLNVSGRAREIDLGNILFNGATPIAVTSSLPTRVEGEQNVKVFVRPGSHVVTITSVIPSMPTSLAVPKHEKDFYDPQEVWVWQPNDALQAVQLSGLTGVDPERTSLPDEWKNQTTYLAEPDQALAFDVTRRGATETAPNDVKLYREIWLDLDGTGYTIRDTVNGTMHRDWRLGYQNVDGASLGRVTQTTDNEGLLITTDQASTNGVEIRESTLGLQAEVRLEDVRREFHIVGWDHDVQSLSGTLHLPPGWTVLHGQGVDRIPNTWMSSWTLWDLFFIFMIVLGFYQLLGFKWAAVAFITLLLTHGHEGAPEWTWIHLIVSLALLRVIPNSIWRKLVIVYRGVAFVVFVVFLAMYANDQIMGGLFPQVAHERMHLSSGPMGMNQEQGMFDGAPPEEPQMAASAEEMEFKEADESEDLLELNTRSGSGVRKIGLSKKGKFDYGISGKKAVQQQRLQQIDPKAVVQTGPGVPDWSWNSWQLNWTGPVRKDQTVTFWLLSSWMNRLLSFVRVILLLLLAFIILAIPDMKWNGGKARKSATVALISFLTVVFFGFNVNAQEQAQQIQNSLGDIGVSAPASSGLLGELKARLLRQADCPDPCVVVSNADINVTGASFEMRADVHARGAAGLRLPGPSSVLAIEDVTIGGVSTRQFRRGKNGLTIVRLTKGSSTVVVRGTLVGRDVITLQFDDLARPEFAKFTSDEWAVDGIDETGSMDTSLQLTRIAKTETEDQEQKGAELPPWYFVTRDVALGLPWQIVTTVSREDATRPQLLKFPLGEGEQVISEGFRVEDKEVIVELPRGVASVQFTSEIPIKPELNLTSSKTKPWTEKWSVECSRIWRCEFSGVPVYQHKAGGVYKPSFYPWPGESLKVAVNRPEGASGASSTVTRVDYFTTPGKRLLLATLTMQVRASQGGWQKVTLPEGAELQTVKVDQADVQIRPADGVVDVPLKPGSQRIELRWQQPWERKVFEQAPKVDIGTDAVNIRVTIYRGDDRWVLAGLSDGPFFGPAWGPAVLFWPRLILMLLIAVAIGRIRRLPVKTYHWMLLVLGLSQLPPVALVPVVGWFLLMRWRKEDPLEEPAVFDLLQLAIPFATLITLAVLYAAIHTNLLIDIDMQVEGAGSTNSEFRWYTDQSGSVLPQPTIVTVSHWFWRIGMLVWALWLVVQLFKWVPWGWGAFTTSGIWRPISNRKRDVPKNRRVDPKPEESKPEESPAADEESE